MGGMYNVVFGQNPHSGELLSVLKLIPEDFGRFRDAFVVDSEIAVYTRIGGRNAQEYRAVYERLEKHPQYSRCENDKFDTTYCTFYFNIPAEAKERLRKFDIRKWEPDKRWQESLEKLKTDPNEAGRIAGRMDEHVKVIDGSTGERKKFNDFLEGLKKPE